MIVNEPKEDILQLIQSETGRAPHYDICQVIGWQNPEGQITGALAYYNANDRSVIVDIALLDGRFPRPLLHYGLWYPFEQLKVKRLTFYVAASNLKSINLVERLGAYREATLQDGCSDGDLHIYCLRPDKCLFWSKLNGQRQRKQATTTSSGT